MAAIKVFLGHSKQQCCSYSISEQLKLSKTHVMGSNHEFISRRAIMLAIIWIGGSQITDKRHRDACLKDVILEQTEWSSKNKESNILGILGSIRNH